jgi:anti-anti-sigma factor
MIRSPLFRLECGPLACVLELQSSAGSFRSHEAATELQAVLQQIAKVAIPHVIVDFHQVPYFGSSLLETLLALWTEIHSRGGTLALCNVSPVAKEIIEVARFDTLWPIHANLASALAVVPTPAS